jgi:hypothetical protein
MSAPLRVLAVDPGFTHSAWCLYEDGRVLEIDKAPNEDALNRVWNEGGINSMSETVLALEMVESFGMTVGREVFRTVLWTGRFGQSWKAEHVPVLIPRRTVKLELCSTSRAKDKNVAQAVRDILGEPPTKARPNTKYPRRPVADEWAAIAVALTYARMVGEGRGGELETLEG